MWKFAWFFFLSATVGPDALDRFVKWVRNNPPPSVSPATPGALEDYLLDGLMYAITGPMAPAEQRPPAAAHLHHLAGTAERAGRGGEQR